MLADAVAHKRQPAQVQSVVGDGQPVAGRRDEQVFTRHPEVFETQAVIVQVLQGVQAVAEDLELLVFLRQLGDEHRGLAGNENDQADHPAGDGVGDEQLFAVDLVIIALELGRGAQGGQVGPGRGLGQGKAGEPLAAGQERQQTGLLLRRAEGAQGIDGPDATVHRRQSRYGRVERCRVE